MASVEELTNTLRNAIEQDANVPDSVSYLTQLGDGAGPEANVTLPVVQLVPLTATNISEFNTDQHSVITNDDGEAIGRSFRSEYLLRIQIDIITVDRRSNDNETIESLSNTVYRALYTYDSAGISQQLHDDVWKVVVEDGERDDDTTTSPTMRRWIQDVLLWSYGEFDTSEDPIKSVDITKSVDFNT